MNRNNTARMDLIAHPDANTETLNARRAYAVSETRNLKKLLSKGMITHDRYLNHIHKLAEYITDSDPPPPPAKISGMRPKVSVLDRILIDFLLGKKEEEDDEDAKRILGNW